MPAFTFRTPLNESAQVSPPYVRGLPATRARRKMSDMKSRVLLVEDEENAFERCAQIVREHPRLELAGTAMSFADALPQIEAHGESFDLLLTDLQLGDGDGADLIKIWSAGGQAREKDNPRRCMVITVFGDVQSVVRAVEAGADGYLLKSGSDMEMVNSITTVLDGGAPISAAVAGHLLRRVRRTAPAQDKAKPVDPARQLSDREIEVLADLARGRSYKEVARKLDISPYTVGDHVKTIYRKLAVSSRGQAVYQAIKEGLIDL